MSDNVEHPSHYNAGGIETIDGIRAALGDAFLDYCRGNVLKYVWRCRHKGKLLEDLRKAAKYLEWAIEEAESEKPSKPQPLAIPEGWRELERSETPKASDMVEHGSSWIARGGDSAVEYESYEERIIREIETSNQNEPQQPAIPEGWRELEENEPLSEDDLFELDGEWVGHECDPSGGVYSSRIHCRHIRKIETDKPGHVEGVLVEEADANAKNIEPTETSDASIPDPGPGYRLLSKDPPERVVEGDDFLGLDGEWIESKNWRAGGVQCSPYYRRKIEPTQWIPKVGDRVRVAKECEVWRYGTIRDIHPKGELFLFQSDDGRYQGWLLADKFQLVEAAS